jgi:hypothetical protein
MFGTAVSWGMRATFNDIMMTDGMVGQTRGPEMTGIDEGEVERTITMRARVLSVPVSTVGHFLTWTDGDQIRRVPISLAGLTVGRQAPSDLVIVSPEISRRHCRLDLDGDWASITDLNSTNGTFVDGERISRPTRLRNGTRLWLGSFQLRYERRDAVEVAQEEELTAELRRAADYVRAILPEPVADGPVRTDWCFVPCARLGGDAFGYQFLDDDTFAGFVLDVSGHGIGSAMHAANVANTLRRRALPGVDFRDPVQVASGLNAVFPMEAHNDLMLTIWYFVYDLPSRTLRFCAAGHHPSLLIAGPEASSLWHRGPAIGMLPNGTWTAGMVAVPPMARLYLFSDGAFEIVDFHGRAWTIDDLRRLIVGTVDAMPLSAHAIWDAVRAAVPSGPLEDDFSVLAVTFA